MDELKAKLDAFIEQNAVTQFEGEDIIELIEEGEDIGWIADQLKGNSPNIETDAVTALLQEIRDRVGPVKPPAYEEPEPPEGEEGDASGTVEAPGTLPDEAGAPDLSQLDLSRLADALPPGMNLPQGFDMNQLKNLLESPQGKIMADFALFCQEKGVEIDEGALDDPRTRKLQDEWKSTPREAFEGKTPAEMLEGSPGGLFPEKVKTFRREEPRVGRNDPCPCGSGKKFKKCCGRA